jgi:hypothetical protein
MALTVVVSPTAYMPAAFAASMPTGASSKMTDRDGSIRLLPDDAYAHNILAWALATHTNPNRRQSAEALEHARKAVALAPKDGNRPSGGK